LEKGITAPGLCTLIVVAILLADALIERIQNRDTPVRGLCRTASRDASWIPIAPTNTAVQFAAGEFHRHSMGITRLDLLDAIGAVFRVFALLALTQALIESG